jgi:predicted TIM-barrel fold metal-dependent hydrolase
LPVSTSGLISADDHVLEPPDLWTSRLPARYRSVGPRIVRERAEPTSTTGGRMSFRRSADPEVGQWADWWLYEDLAVPLTRVSVASGLDEVDFVPVTFDEIRPGCWQQGERLRDMDANGVDASVCFPNTLPRFCGQTFAEADDRELAALCVRAYNDWIVDEWCAGDGRGRLIPVTLVPLWDVAAAVAEVHRCAAKGSFALSFSENPALLGLPSIHDAGGHWEPLFAACADTGTVLNMHIGSSSTVPTTAADAPQAVSSALFITNTMGALCDYLVSGVFERHPGLRISLSEGQVGWMPYLLDRLDQVWAKRDGASLIGIDLPRPPSSYLAGHVYGCIFDDAVGLENRARIGMEQILFEVDYPHSDSTFPRSQEAFDRVADAGGLDDHERYLLARGNAIAAFGLDRFGITA